MKVSCTALAIMSGTWTCSPSSRPRTRTSSWLLAIRVVDLSDEHAQSQIIAWWQRHTESGGEGLVFKPLDWIVHGKRGLVQPAVKCRGREYLRIIYGPEYTTPHNLERLRPRRLPSSAGWRCASSP